MGLTKYLFFIFKILPILLIVGMFIIIGFVIWDQFTFDDRAVLECKKLDMELFDATAGSMFTHATITCWDPDTKETRIIK